MRSPRSAQRPTMPARGTPRHERALQACITLVRRGYALDAALAAAIGAFALGSGDVRRVRVLVGLSV